MHTRLSHFHLDGPEWTKLKQVPSRRESKRKHQKEYEAVGKGRFWKEDESVFGVARQD